MATKTVVEEVKEIKRVDPAKVKQGDLMAILTWVRVNSNNAAKTKRNYWDEETQRHLLVTDLDKDSEHVIKVSGEDLIANMFSADYFSETKQVNKTDLVTTFIHSFNVPMTVVADTSKEKDRVFRCRLIKSDPLFGKSMVEDLDKAKNDRLRWIMHENIKSLIVQGTKYVIKGVK